MSERYIRYYDSNSGTTTTSTYSFDKTKKYKLNKSSGSIEEITTSNPLADDEITIAGSKSSLRRLGDLERNVSILASKAGVSGATNTDTDTVLKNNNQALHATDALRISANKLYLYKGDGTSEYVDLSLYLDDTNAAVIQSGVVNGAGIATFTRDDASTFTVDMSVLLDDTNLPRITSAGWNTSDGVLTLTRNDNTTITVDLDGRFQPAGSYSLTSHNHTLDSLSNTTITSNSAGEILKWNGSAWVNNTLAEAGIYSTSNPAGYTTNVGTVTSVSGTGTVSGLTLTGSVTTSGSLTLGGAITGFATDSHNHTLDSLSNTTITSNTAGEILKWNGSAWVNNTLAEAGISATSHNHTLDSLSNTTITSVTDGEFLVWDTTTSKWINNTLAEAGINNGIFTVSAGTDLSGSGSTSANASADSSATISHANISRSDTTSSQTATHTGTFTAVDSITTSATGHVTAVNLKTVTLPSDNNTWRGITDTPSNDSATSISAAWAYTTPFTGVTVSNDTLTFSRPDGTTTAVTTSDANTNYYVTGGTFDSSTQVLTLTRNSGSATVDLSGLVTSAELTAAISDLVNGADAAYDTLLEIQNAMATDAELSAAIAGLTIGNGTQTIAAGTAMSGGGSFTANQTGNSSVTISHANVTSTPSTSTASPAHGGTFTAVDSVTVNAQGHVTGVNTKTVTLPSDNNTDTLQGITNDTTTNATYYPSFVTATSGAQAGKVSSTKLTFNPSTGTLAATAFSGSMAYSNLTGVPTIGNGLQTIVAGTDLATGGSFTANQSTDTSVTLDHAAVARTNTTSSAAPAHSGTFTVVDSITTSSTGHITGVNTKTITLPADNNTTYGAATSTVLGLVKLEDDTVQSVAANAVSATASRTYGVQANSSGQLVVNVPWVDTNTNTTYSAGSGITLTGTTFSNAAPDQTVTLTGSGATTVSGTYPNFTISSTDTDTVYTLPAATSTVRGGIELFSDTVQSVAANAVSATASRTYGVQVNSAGQAVVNVPWVDTNTNTDTLQSIADDTATNATYYPSFVTATSGAQTGKVSSTKLTFNPSTGKLSSTSLDATGGFADIGDLTIDSSSYGTNGTVYYSNAIHNFAGSIVGSLTGNVTGNVSGSSGSTTGNAATATTLETARTIGMSGVTATAQSFNGGANITIPVTAVPATLLTGTIADARISGSYTGMVNLTGSGTVDFAKFLGNAADTVSAPSFSWTGDTTTGIYRPAASQMAVTIAGTQRGLWSASGLSVTGAITATGDVTAYSDDRLKTDITTIDGALDKVAKVRGVNFTRKEDGSRSTGVVAQELAAVLPEAVKTDANGMHHVAYGNITGLLIEAIKELKDEIDYLKGLK